MSATTSSSNVDIAYFVDPESIVGNADPAWNDSEASVAAYVEELAEALEQAWPDAAIEVRTGHGFSFAFDGEEDIMESVSSIANTIFERGTFWQGPTVSATTNVATLAQAVYALVYDGDDKHHRAATLARIEDWLNEGDLRPDECDPNALAREWAEYDTDEEAE